MKICGAVRLREELAGLRQARREVADRAKNVCNRENEERHHVGEEGYFTLEASIIATMMCCMALAIFVIALYFHDLSAVEGYMREQAIIESSLLQKTEGKDSFSKKQIEELLIISKIKSCNVIEKGNSIIAEATVSIDFPIPYAAEWIGRTWTKQIYIKLEQGNMEEKIRRWDMIGE